MQNPNEVTDYLALFSNKSIGFLKNYLVSTDILLRFQGNKFFSHTLTLQKMSKTGKTSTLKELNLGGEMDCRPPQQTVQGIANNHNRSRQPLSQ